LAVGADEVTAAIEQAACSRDLAIEIIRTGSRGLYWLEPMVEAQSPAGRIAYGPVTSGDAAGLLDAVVAGGPHPLHLGLADDFPWLKRQTRLTFARCGIVDPRSLDGYRAHGGCKGWNARSRWARRATIEEVVQSGLRGRGGAGFPTGIKWRTVAATQASQKYNRLQRRRRRQRHLRRPHDHGRRSFRSDRGMTIAGVATGATKGYVYIRSEYPHAVAAMEAAVTAARRGGVLGPRVADSAHAFDIEVRVGAGAYVCGEGNVAARKHRRQARDRARQAAAARALWIVRPANGDQ